MRRTTQALSKRRAKRRCGGLAMAVVLGCGCAAATKDASRDAETGSDAGDAGGGDARDATLDIGEDPVACTSGLTWGDGVQASTRMKPGNACIACHASTPGSPPFAIAGTVYPTLHEPDDCYGVAKNVQVEITDSAGRVLLLPVNSAGNFFQFASESVSPPFRARVLFDGGVRSMNQTQVSGDCNGCHTQFGANGAPGRILAR